MLETAQPSGGESSTVYAWALWSTVISISTSTDGRLKCTCEILSVDPVPAEEILEEVGHTAWSGSRFHSPTPGYPPDARKEIPGSENKT